MRTQYSEDLNNVLLVAAYFARKDGKRNLDHSAFMSAAVHCSELFANTKRSQKEFLLKDIDMHGYRGYKTDVIRKAKAENIQIFMLTETMTECMSQASDEEDMIMKGAEDQILNTKYLIHAVLLNQYNKNVRDMFEPYYVSGPINMDRIYYMAEKLSSFEENKMCLMERNHEKYNCRSELWNMDVIAHNRIKYAMEEIRIMNDYLKQLDALYYSMACSIQKECYMRLTIAEITEVIQEISKEKSSMNETNDVHMNVDSIYNRAKNTVQMLTRLEMLEAGTPTEIEKIDVKKAKKNALESYQNYKEESTQEAKDVCEHEMIVYAHALMGWICSDTDMKDLLLNWYERYEKNVEDMNSFVAFLHYLENRVPRFLESKLMKELNINHNVNNALNMFNGMSEEEKKIFMDRLKG